jgi:DNA-binding LacI/PurR family transcriptional regulator
VNTVAVLVGGLNPFYLSLLRGIEDVAAEQGTLVLVTDTRDSPTLAEAMIRRLIARGVDGIVAVSVGGIGTNAGAPPIVYVDQPDRTGYVLLFDGHGAGNSATRHLREHGHERIGIVTAPLSWPNVREVYEGYVQAVGEADGRLVAEVGEFTVDAGRAGLEVSSSCPILPPPSSRLGRPSPWGCYTRRSREGSTSPPIWRSPATRILRPPRSSSRR